MITMAITIAFRNVINEDQRLSIIMTIGWQLPSFTIDLITIVSHHFSIGFASQANPRDPGSLILQIHRPEHTSTHTHMLTGLYIIYIFIYLFIFIYVYPHTLIPSGRLVRRPSFRHCCGGFGVGGVGFGGMRFWMRFWRGWGGRNNGGCVGGGRCGCYVDNRSTFSGWGWYVDARSLLRCQGEVATLMLDSRSAATFSGRRCYVDAGSLQLFATLMFPC